MNARIECPWCRGTGSGPQDNVECSFCHGRGCVSRTLIYNEVLMMMERAYRKGELVTDFQLDALFGRIPQDIKAVMDLLLRQHRIVIVRKVGSKHAYGLPSEG